MQRRCVSPMLSGYPCLAMKTRSFYYILLESSVKFNAFVLISCRMVAEGLGKLCILTRWRSSKVHKKILEHFMIPSGEDLFENDSYLPTRLRILLH
ncbi:hypothetical protein NPIL_201761 [Nephila pilipes]|uniref:Uncharacterized protein n=1 Tax=Nephila pilipes TaxID=299642 RepID=A0A8X6TFS4_NEPPI|nr:hypothetical protein NPIL_201761 [Nephila pilipes]